MPPFVAQREQPETEDQEREAELRQRKDENEAKKTGRPAAGERRESAARRTLPMPIARLVETTTRIVGAHLPGRRIVVPKSSATRIGASHSSQTTANADGIGAAQLGQRCLSAPAHWGHEAGS